MKHRENRLTFLIRGLHIVEDTLLVGCLVGMASMAFFQIVLRNLAHTGLYWIEGLLRYSVLWLGLLGAMVATREDNHISIDVVSFLLPVRPKAAVRVFTDGFASLVCLTLGWASIGFIRSELNGGMKAFGSLPVWIAELVIPVCMITIGLRYLRYMFIHLQEALWMKGETEDHRVKGY